MKSVFSINSKVLGNGPVKFEWQKKKGNFIVAVGANKNLLIYDHQGIQVDLIPLSGDCLSLNWSPDGDVLAILQDKSSSILMWDSGMKAISTPLETNMKNLNIMQWSLQSDYLAVGTTKGNLLLYNRVAGKKIPILGKHTKSIISMVWSIQNILACTSEDRTFTLTNTTGDTTFQMGLKGDSSNLIKWNNNSTDKDDQILTIVLSNRTLFFHSQKHPESPMELAFQSRYGSIVAYSWFGEGLVMIGFSSGYVVVISTNMNEIGQEKFQSRDFKDTLNDISVCLALNKAATCGDNCVKIHDLSDLKDVSDIITFEDERGQLDKVQWSDDGQFISISTKLGNVYTYLSRLPTIGSVFGSHVAYLSSLLEITVADQSTASDLSSGTFIPNIILRKQLEIEPTGTALGPCHLAVFSNNVVWYYGLGRNISDTKRDSSAEVLEIGILVLKKEYTAQVVSISMNESHAAVVLKDGRMNVHALDKTGEKTAKFFPEKTKVVNMVDSASNLSGNLLMKITCASIDSNLLCFGSAEGMLVHYTVGDWVLVNEMKHKAGIEKIYTNPKGGTKLIFRDINNETYVFTPNTDFLMPIPAISASIQDITWERSPKNKSFSFIAWDKSYITVYVYHPLTIKGPQCLALGATKLPHGLKPILLYDGALTCQTSSGRLSVVHLSTYEMHKDLHRLSEQDQGKYLQLHYTTGKIAELWDCLNHIQSKAAWKMVSESALHILDLPTAIRINRQILNDPGMVQSLINLQKIDDRNLLCGHIAAICGDYNLAQEFMLDSSYPIAALELKRDLLQWEQALGLAAKLAPEQVSEIAMEYAQQLEFNGKYADALAMYDQALSTIPKDEYTSEEELNDLQFACSCGLTRMTLILGDISRGMKMLAEATDRQLLYDCGVILEGIKQYNEAGGLFEKAEYWEKAAEVYIKAKNWAKVGSLLPQITSSKIFAQFAKAKEALGSFAEAAAAYEKARDYDNVVRLYVENLQNIEGAVSIVRKTRSREAAKIVSRFFQSIRDYKSVVEFCLMANMKDEAFVLAQQHDVMEHYAQLVNEDASTETLLNISSYFESKKQFIQAGKFLMQAGNYPRALKMFLESPSPDGTALEFAIQAVGLSKNEALAHELLDYLMGEADGIPKDAKFIFKMYMAIGKFKEASKTAIIIAREEQALGNYRAAHDVLLDNFKQLRSLKIPIPSEIDRMLMLLHSYVLVKTLVRIDEHEMGARMLIRVSNNVSKFPAHVVPILTSTVVECYRAGLKKSAFEFAAMLMRPEYRQKIDAKYKRKIEQIVRRPEQTEPEEMMTPCTFCLNPVAETNLTCFECKCTIPYCIATGKHMTLKDWSMCPKCEFPALLEPFKLIVIKTNCCPMCSAEITENDIVVPSNIQERLKSQVFENDDQGSKERLDIKKRSDDGTSSTRTGGLAA